MTDAAQPTLLRPRTARAGRLIAVASGKGGVGKTWLAVTLSHALARAGRRVLLFDADLGLANVDIQLGLVPEGDLGAVVAGRLPLERVLLRHDAGFDVLPGCSGSGALAALDAPALEAVLRALREVARGYSDVVLDLGAGVEPTVRRLAAVADLLLVVATAEPTSLTDAYAVLKLHAADGGGAARVVVNQASSRAAGERTYATLARACAAFLGRTPPCAAIIRRDERVSDAIRHQTPLLTRHPAAPAAADVEALAGALT
ncbi:MAG: AAA family ATPase [Alphaproteobacteria bacterium]|nr:AAA family ATPase [Alphaproteobacteria bacterium]